MAKLSEILSSKAKVELEFVDLIQDEAQRDGSPIVKLVLKNPLPVVYGRRITDNVTGDTIGLEARDVEMVSIGAEALQAIDDMETAEMQKPEKDRKMPFQWVQEGKSGKLTCNLKLDVSQSQEVWVVKTSLAQFGRNQRQERRNRQNSTLIDKIKESKTRAEFKNTDVNAPVPPEPVTSETKEKATAK